MEGTTEVVRGMFSTEQITSIQTSLGTAIENVLSMFVSLLPVMATIAGVAFGIALVRRSFKKTSQARA